MHLKPINTINNTTNTCLHGEVLQIEIAASMASKPERNLCGRLNPYYQQKEIHVSYESLDSDKYSGIFLLVYLGCKFESFYTLGRVKRPV